MIKFILTYPHGKKLIRKFSTIAEGQFFAICEGASYTYESPEESEPETTS